jgi:RNA polymerase sigma-70 factor, ECF subfamily
MTEKWTSPRPPRERLQWEVVGSYSFGEMLPMKSQTSSQVTRLLHHLQAGDRSAVDRLFHAVYQGLRDLADQFFRREPPGQTIQPTALVHEAYIKLIDQKCVDWQGQAHFLAVAAQAMRRILLDRARRRGAAKRGGGWKRVTLDDRLIPGFQSDEHLVALDEALVRLEQLDPRQAQMVELRFFGGLSVEETAKVLGVSKRSAEREWTMVRAWLRRELDACPRTPVEPT